MGNGTRRPLNIFETVILLAYTGVEQFGGYCIVGSRNVSDAFSSFDHNLNRVAVISIRRISNQIDDISNVHSLQNNFAAAFMVYANNINI